MQLKGKQSSKRCRRSRPCSRDMPTQTRCRLQYKGYNRRQTRVCLSVCLSVGVIKEHTHTDARERRRRLVLGPACKVCNNRIKTIHYVVLAQLLDTSRFPRGAARLVHTASAGTARHGRPAAVLCAISMLQLGYQLQLVSLSRRQVSAESPPSALNMTLPAFAAERGRLLHGARGSSRSLSPAHRALSSKPACRR